MSGENIPSESEHNVNFIKKSNKQKKRNQRFRHLDWVERGFSLQNRIKTAQWSRLAESKVSRLMRISSCTETLHSAHTLDFKTAAAHFTHAKMRKKSKKKENLSRDFFQFVCRVFIAKQRTIYYYYFKLPARRVIMKWAGPRCVLCLQIIVSEKRPSVSLCRLWAQGCAIFIL